MAWHVWERGSFRYSLDRSLPVLGQGLRRPSGVEEVRETLDMHTVF